MMAFLFINYFGIAFSFQAAGFVKGRSSKLIQ